MTASLLDITHVKISAIAKHLQDRLEDVGSGALGCIRCGIRSGHAVHIEFGIGGLDNE
jgi:hypothetical protein